MKIQLWNAFASNNSGSYTLVGSFESVDVAIEVANELREVLEAHQKWFFDPARGSVAPLDEWCEKRELTSAKRCGRSADWPQYGTVPKVGALNRKVVLFVDETLSMAPIFGEFFYTRGGRVDTELIHVEVPLVWIHDCWWPHELAQDNDKLVAACVALLEEALGIDGPLFEYVDLTMSPTWRGPARFTSHLRIAVVWDEPVAGATALLDVARRHGVKTMTAQVIEAFDERDPTSMLRPSHPAIAGLEDVEIRDFGEKREALLWYLNYEMIGLTGNHQHTEEMVDGTIPVVRTKPAEYVAELADALTALGAEVIIRTG